MFAAQLSDAGDHCYLDLIPLVSAIVRRVKGILFVDYVRML